MQPHVKIVSSEDGTRSYSRALNVIVYGGVRGFRGQGGRCQGRRRGNGEGNSSNSDEIQSGDSIFSVVVLGRISLG